MAPQDLISTLDKKDFLVFKKDFLQLIRVAYGMNDYYIKSDIMATRYMPAYENLIKLFNRKYPCLKLKIFRKDSLKLELFIKEKKPLKEVFIESAAKIPGLKSIGSESFDAADVSESGKFSNELENIRNKVHIAYDSDEKTPYLVFLKSNKKSGTIQVKSTIDEMLDEHNPNFKLCAYYALKKKHNKKIKLFENAAKLGFISALTDDELKNILNNFNPLMNE